MQQDQQTDGQRDGDERHQDAIAECRHRDGAHRDEAGDEDRKAGREQNDIDALVGPNRSG